MTNKFKIRHHQITAYHPRANGLIERLNGTLKQMLAKITLEEKDWDRYISPCLFAYRTSKIEGIGTTPAFLAMGLHPRLPMEATKEELIWEHLKHLVVNVPLFRKEALERMLEKQGPQPVWEPHFKIRDRVLLLRSAQGKSLKQKWDGPFTIIGTTGLGTYRILKDDGRNDVIHSDRLRMYQPRPQLEPIVVVERQEL